MGLFRFKQFSVEQSQCAMKVGTDGVLLGAWVGIDGNESRVLDIGTGTGLIALMVAQRAEDAQIVAVEIEPQAAEQASENFQNSKWSARLSIEQCAVQEYVSAQKFDLIVSNPPYFIDSLHAPSQSRTTARHTTELPFEDIITASQRLLSSNGRLAIILPTEESERFDTLAQGALHLSRRCLVRGKQGGQVRRIMSEYTLTLSSPSEPTELAVRATPPQEYTDEYMALTAQFYLKF